MEKMIEDLQTGSSKDEVETQLTIGRHFLKKGDSVSDEESSKLYEKGVQWLIKASKQGSRDATQLLLECLENQKGLADDNIEDIRWCLETPDFEKNAREAAKRLFHTLNPSRMRMTKEDFMQGIANLTMSKSERKLLEKAVKGDDVGEEDFINKIMKRLHGSSRPQLSTSDDVSQEVGFETATPFQKITKYPTMTLAWIANYTVDAAGSQGRVWLYSMIPTHQIYMLLVFFVYSLISLDVILWVLPLLMFYISFIVMLVCTLQMLYGKKKLKDVKALAELLNRFSDTIHTETAASMYSWSSLTPYLSFFVALLFSVMSLSMADRTWVPCSEFTLVSLLLTIASFFALSDKFDYLSILSILFDNISMLPQVIEGIPYIPGVYHIIQIFAGSWYSIEILPDLQIHFGLPSLAYLLVPVLFIRMALKDSGRGTYRVLIPHLVCFFWWRMSMSFYRYSTWVGLIRASVGWVSAVVFLPIFMVIFLVWLTIQLFGVFTLTNVFKMLTSVALLAIPAAFAFWGSKGYKLYSFDLGKSKSTLIKVGLVLIFAASVIPFTFVFTPPERNVQGNYVTWDKYKSLCSKPQWDETNIAHSMVICSHLSNMMVDWSGVVKKVTVKKIDNQAEAFINALPWSMANWLKCTYGEEYPSDCTNLTSTIEQTLCEMNIAQNRNCHLKKLNRYQFEMWVTMVIDNDNMHDIRVEASHWFKDSMMKIQSGDTVRFRAALKSEIGNIWPILKLFYVECENCPMEVIGESSAFYQQTGWHIFVAIRDAIRAVWNFFMAPLLVFS
ncbi:hypothetical protein CAPTEDRAFT_205743 [Capitella teleta]|uniref:Wolframin n=1 Tax=Capitella teleta TaxID=283909 RepID=R7TX79_CAPTE|nr:hypothetical protein CAPTEDRAFT_205743 [Capitella teleta]|eukprot:ELT98538.1 hypothetical protein CAPTEDRAFT_205743 [Capitella teleta]